MNPINSHNNPLLFEGAIQVFFLCILYCILACLWIQPVMAVPYPYGEPEYSATVEGDNTLHPGNITPLTIVITNTAHAPEKILDPVDPVASSPVIGMGLTLTLTAGDAPVDIIATPLTIPVLPPSVKVPVTFPVIIRSDASAGTFSLPLEVTSRYVDSIAMEGTGTNVFHYSSKNVTLEIPVRIKPVVRVRVTDIVATNMSPGQHGRISATITNTGDYNGKNAIAMLVPDPQSPIFPYQGTYFLGTFSPGEQRDVNWRIEVRDEIDTTTIPVTLVISYEDEDGLIETSDPVMIGIPISKGPKFSLSYDKLSIEPGATANIRATFTNTGDEPAHDATAKIVPIAPVSSEGTTASFGTLLPGESADAVFKISLDSEALVKPYGILTNVKYLGEDGIVALSDPMQIEIETAPHGILAFLFSPISLVVIFGLLLIGGYMVLNREGRLI